MSDDFELDARESEQYIEPDEPDDFDHWDQCPSCGYANPAGLGRCIDCGARMDGIPMWLDSDRDEQPEDDQS